MSWPSTRTSPEVIETMPQTTLISVVLPAPLGPSSAKISPLAISRLMASIATRPESNRLVTATTEMIGDIDSPYPPLGLVKLQEDKICASGRIVELDLTPAAGVRSLSSAGLPQPWSRRCPLLPLLWSASTGEQARFAPGSPRPTAPSSTRSRPRSGRPASPAAPTKAFVEAQIGELDAAFPRPADRHERHGRLAPGLGRGALCRLPGRRGGDRRRDDDDPNDRGSAASSSFPASAYAIGAARPT